MLNPQLIIGDALSVLPTLDAGSVDSIVTDPPYGLSFMGKDWDHGVPGEHFWREAIRVAKPGAHLLAFGGTRTFHRLACAIEDAGWEIRDCIMWVYGSGFPKSLDASKAIDKVNGDGGRLLKFTAWMRTTGLTARQIDTATETNMGGHYLTAKSQPAIPTPELWVRLRPLCGDVPAWVDELVERIEAEREVVGQKTGLDGSGFGNVGHGLLSATIPITAPATDAARQWQGFGTALKPSWEPIIVARKPLSGTVAENLLRHGTGAINVDGCRISHGDDVDMDAVHRQQSQPVSGFNMAASKHGIEVPMYKPGGRWPANLIHDGSDEAVAGFPESGGSGPARVLKRGTRGDSEGWGMQDEHGELRDAGSGSAARFFYCAKASSEDRGEGNTHPTVKPHALMRYLCRLVTPPNGLVLDPFMGSGSTGLAAWAEGFRFIGIDLEASHVAIADRRFRDASPMFLEPIVVRTLSESPTPPPMVGCGIDP